jgi:hypothetical protein
MDGNYHIFLMPGVSDASFVEHVLRNFSDSSFATRVTRAITSRLLKVENSGFAPEYVLQVSVDLMNNRPYRFKEHIADVSALVESFGIVSPKDVYTLVESESSDSG